MVGSLYPSVHSIYISRRPVLGSIMTSKTPPFSFLFWFVLGSTKYFAVMSEQCFTAAMRHCPNVSMGRGEPNEGDVRRPT